MSRVVVTFNGTILDDADLCTLDTCSLQYASFRYVPNLAGNLLYLAIFGILIIPQLYFGIRFRTWGYMAGMLGGLLLEVIGYVARVQLHFNPFPFGSFLMYLICLTIGPAFFCAAIYLCLSRIVVMYGEKVSRLKPRTYTIMFISSDFFSLVLQAVGGGITSTANDDSTRQSGVNIMIAGLSTQVASLTIFMILCADFASRLRKSPHNINSSTYAVRNTFKWKAFLFCLAGATITIFVRSLFRVAELSQGFEGALANDEITFMILEGAMIVIACLCLTAFHPGISFSGKWDQGNFTLRTLKSRDEEQSSPTLEMSDRSALGPEGAYETDNSLKVPYTQA